MSWAKAHRWLAILLVVLLAVWSVTGLLFHLKPGWSRAYDMLSAERRGPLQPSKLVALSTVGDDITGLELIDTALGPIYRVSTSQGTSLVDATTGAKKSPLSLADARTLVADAISRSSHAATYGELETADLGDSKVAIACSGGRTIEISRNDGRISQRGRDTDRIDWLYRIHYLQWTGNKTFDRAFSIFGLALIWAVVFPGLVLFVRRWRA
ncbi:MAG: PepSY domain-containing protein [Deltaproteobacteria bacterium]|nr:PepSY domain-containing protein [Deltaproteobacteria bacterium]